MRDTPGILQSPNSYQAWLGWVKGDATWSAAHLTAGYRNQQSDRIADTNDGITSENTRGLSGEEMLGQ